MIKFDKYCASRFLYLFDKDGKFITEFVCSRGAWGKFPQSGRIELLDDPGIIPYWPDAYTFRKVEDPLAEQVLRAQRVNPMHMEEDKAIDHLKAWEHIFPFFHLASKEMRTTPVIELAPYTDTYVGKQSFKTDLHRHIAIKHLFKLSNHHAKTKMEIILKDPITGKRVDETYHVTIKIEKLFDGFPELYQEKEDITIKNGVYEYEFNAPTTDCNLFFKVKPQSKSYVAGTDTGEQGKESKGYNISKYVCAFTYRN